MAVNKVILVGNVGKDPEVRYLDNNVAVARFSIATTERGFKTKSGQTVPEKTEWHNIVLWRGLAEIAEKYVKKGTQLYLEGKLQTNSWEDKDGNKRYTTEIVGNEMQMLGRKSDNPYNADAPASKPAASKAAPKQADPFDGGDTEDDLPF